MSPERVGCAVVGLCSVQKTADASSSSLPFSSGVADHEGLIEIIRWGSSG